MINTQFNSLKLGALQPAAIVNTIQQAAGWCEVYGNSGHLAGIYAANPESVMYVGNTQRTNYGNAYNIKWKNQSWNAQPQQI